MKSPHASNKLASNNKWPLIALPPAVAAVAFVVASQLSPSSSSSSPSLLFIWPNPFCMEMESNRRLPLDWPAPRCVRYARELCKWRAASRESRQALGLSVPIGCCDDDDDHYSCCCCCCCCDGHGAGTTTTAARPSFRPSRLLFLPGRDYLASQVVVVGRCCSSNEEGKKWP